jgi:hypothetical protein
MRFMKRLLLGALALLLPSLAQAQGTLPLALVQQFSFTNCAAFTNSCGTPLIGGLLYFYQIGTVGTVQNSFQDTGLTLPNPWPLVLDSNGRVPNFYLANGSVHVRLTDANGVVQFDIPSTLVIGASSGSGGGGAVDPTTIASTGDVKFRFTSEFVTGWVKANAQTIGSATSGATQRANADTQALFIYEWTNCPDTHCPVLGGRGASGLADFTANKQLTLPDCRGRICGVGLDDMGNAAAGRIFAQNVTSGGGDTVTTPNATGGEARHTMTLAELVNHNHPVFLNDPGHTHTVPAAANTAAPVTLSFSGNGADTNTKTSNSNTTGITVRDTTGGGGTANQTATTGSATAFNVMTNFMLGTWYLKL